jgi:hypothetical protein
MLAVRLAILLTLVACGPAAPAPSTTRAAAAPAEPAAPRRPGAGAHIASGRDATPDGPEAQAASIAGGDQPAAPPTPWAVDPLEPEAVPRVFLVEHRKAANRETCPLLVPTEVEAGARPRRANFSGGWAVAYDKDGAPGTRSGGEPCASCGRSAFGVAGTGAEKGGGGPAWPREVAWSDGSRAGYGPEGGQGPHLLAYLERADAGCLYNVWSALGEEHLLKLIASLRRVRGE